MHHGVHAVTSRAQFFVGIMFGMAVAAYVVLGFIKRRLR